MRHFFIGIGAVLIAFPVCAATANNQAVNNSKVALSHEANDMIAQTDNARKAVGIHHRAAAVRDVKQALAEIQKIETAQPNERIVPIYSEIERISIIGPVQAAKSRANTSGTAERSANPSKRAAVREVTGGFTEVGVDVNASKEHLQAALRALDKNDWKGADAALNEVETGVVMERMESDLPLLRARENLAVAQAAERQNRWTETRTALRAAGSALNEYAQTRPARANDAKDLTRQIDQYAANIATNHNDANARIQGWWNEITDWMPSPPSK